MNILRLLHQTVTQLTEEKKKKKNQKHKAPQSSFHSKMHIHSSLSSDLWCTLTSVTTLQNDPSQGKMMSAKQGSYFRIDYYSFASFETKF